MSGQPTWSLSEALTALAFHDPTPAAMLPDALESRRWDDGSADARMRLNAAVQTLCNAGYRADLKIWGRPILQSASVPPHLGATRKLDQAECLDNRRFVPGRDGLWPGSGDGDEYAEMFSAEDRGGGFDEVRVDRAELKRLLSMANHSTARAEDECEVWLRKQFEADPAKLKKRGAFAADARKYFGKRLSGRGFSRVWAKVAPEYGRDKSGRPKSNQNTN